jgi:hypothetical protein
MKESSPNGRARGQRDAGAGLEEAEDRRLEPRYPASAVPQITAVRIAGGFVTLVNISSTGILVESATRQVPGKRISLELEGAIEPKRVSASIVRCQVAAIEDGSLKYRTALMFTDPLKLPVDEAGHPHAFADTAGRSPAREEHPSAVDVVTPEPARVFNRW